MYITIGFVQYSTYEHEKHQAALHAANTYAFLLSGVEVSNTEYSVYYKQLFFQEAYSNSTFSKVVPLSGKNVDNVYSKLHLFKYSATILLAAL